MKCPGDFLLHTPLWEAKTQLVQKENYISKQAVSAGSDISLALSVHFLSTPSGGENSFLDILFILM